YVFYIARYIERKDPTDHDFEKERLSIAYRERQKAAYSVMKEWEEDVEARANITFTIEAKTKPEEQKETPEEQEKAPVKQTE
ncbi:MAG: hypothetical protein ABIH42_06145, partial [Planctomycetota bacterium]